MLALRKNPSIKTKRKEIEYNSDSSSDGSGSASESEDEQNSDITDHENHISDDDDFQMSGSDPDSGSDPSDEESQIDVGNTGWANSMAKVLNATTPKNKKSVVLSKAKKYSELESKKQKPAGFEIEGEIKDEIKEEESNGLEISTHSQSIKKQEHRRIKNELRMLRVKPSIFERERDKTFKKIATRGVVQLFNAVRMQQKDLDQQLDKAGRLDHKRDRVINNLNKKAFIDVLMGGSRAKSELIDNPVKDEDIKSEDDFDGVESNDKGKKTTWSVLSLKDDFLTGKKNSHWDREDDKEAEINQSDEDNIDTD